MAGLGNGSRAYWILVGRPNEKRPLGKPGRSWKYNIKMNLQSSGVECHGLDCCGPVEEQMAAVCAFGNEHLDSIKCGIFLDRLRNCQLLKRDFAPWS